jgi:glutathione S-transferase
MGTPSKLLAAKDQVFNALSMLDALIAKGGGDFLLGQAFSLVDVVSWVAFVSYFATFC